MDSGNLALRGVSCFGMGFAIGFVTREKTMTEENKAEIKLDLPRKPLEPVGDGVCGEQSAAYDRVLGLCD